MTRLILALNVEEADEARKLLELFGTRIDLYKIGIDLWVKCGPELVREFIAAGAGVFLDLKFSDIPSVVEKAVSAATELGVQMLTVHAMGGAEMMLAATRAARITAEQIGRQKPLVVAVTVLTSLDRTALTQITGFSQEVENRVLALAELAQSVGCDGVVASPREIRPLKKRCGPKFVVVTPGIRLKKEPDDDQLRFLTPQEAAQAGADYIVVGRPIYQAADPLTALEQIRAQIGR
ncbi:MAG: orotidine-5'-phosphate decarboxylase [candidate division WOR-3 bacterium]|uniref:Orotidine 5'-phosphate decarboxylase n=2 Tax=candidate division WOR-3 bacterium TaxID=2052148 RepID=A0A7C1SRD1_UNCW3|nr:orotidine-5'-phosphate decarboxylase [candidate division WOR-3 bacterium]